MTPKQRRIRKALRAAATVAVPMASQYSLIYGTPNQGDQVTGGSADVSTGAITVPRTAGRLEIAHELGHLLDYQSMTDADRGRFETVLGFKPGAWDTGTGVHGGYQSPAEAFADYYAAAATGFDPTRQAWSSYVQIKPKKLIRFRRALNRYAARHPELQAYHNISD